MVVDAAQEFGPIIIPSDNEFDLHVSIPDGNNWGPIEHGSALYAKSAAIVFGGVVGGITYKGLFAQEILDSYEYITVRIGSNGFDVLYGDSGLDAIFGLNTSDFIYGGGSRDLIDGGEGGDDLRGEGGVDLIYGGAAGDFIYGGTEGDQIFGGDSDSMIGDSGDFLYGEDGADTLGGGVGADQLYGGEADDKLYGGSNDDKLVGETGSDQIDGGDGFDTAVFASSFNNYTLTALSNGTFTVRANAGASDAGTDTLVRVEYLTFGNETLRIEDWVTRAGGTVVVVPTPVDTTPYVPPSSTTESPVGVSNSLLSVTPVNKNLLAGQSIALGDLFPSGNWVDNDGAYDIRWIAVQDRSAGGGYLTYKGNVVAANTVHEFTVAELVNWRFVAGSTAAVDQIGFNIIQADGDYSPRLTNGATVTTTVPDTPLPPDPTPTPDPVDEARLDLDQRSDNTFEEGDHIGFTIERRGSLDGDIVVQWTIVGTGSHPADRRDFLAMSGTFTLYDGQDERNFNIMALEDHVDEFDEDYRVELQVVSGAATFDDSSESLTIIDNDEPLGIDPNVDDHGGSFAAATEVAENTWVRGFIEQPGDRDYFRFDLLGGVGYQFQLHSDGGLWLIDGDPNADYQALLDPIADVFDGAGNYIATLDSIQVDTIFSYNFETVTDGTFYLAVREDGDNDVGQYFVSADVATLADDYAGNATTTGVAVMDGVTFGHHERLPDIDWFSITLEAGTTYRFSLLNEARLELGEFGVPYPANGSSLGYYFGQVSAELSVLNASGNVVQTRTTGFPTSNNLIEFTASASGTYFLSVDGTISNTGSYAIVTEAVQSRPDTPALVLQPGSDLVTDVRFPTIRDSELQAIDDDTLTVNAQTTSAIRFDITSVAAPATYAAIELFLYSSAHAQTGDLVVDVPGAALGNSSLFGEIDTLEFLTAIPNPVVGQWVTINITELYNRWVSGEQANNGIVLSTSELNSSLMSFYSSNYTGDPLLRPRLVLDGPDIVQAVFGETSGALSEDDHAVTGTIGLTGSDTDFGGATFTGSWGSIAVDDHGNLWTYTLDARAEALAEGQVVEDVLTLTTESGLSQNISVTILGQNDRRVVIGAGAHNMQESVGRLGGSSVAYDADATTQPTFRARNLDGTYGTFKMAADGSWTYVLDAAGRLALGNGAVKTDTFVVRTSDGVAVRYAMKIDGTINDQIDRSGVSVGESFSGGTGNDTLSLGSGNDELFGGSGDDILSGGLGNDLISGNTGKDTASFVKGLLSTTVDLSKSGGQNTGHGNDTLTGIENIVSGGGADVLIGNSGANSISSGTGDDRLRGGGGNDTLNSGPGDDTVTGGSGSDIFVFSANLISANTDMITDINVVEDTIWLQNTVFTGLTEGALPAEAFRSNGTGNADDATDRIIYNTLTGDLMFDSDGTGAAAGIRFAVVTTGLTLTSLDFLVV